MDIGFRLGLFASQAENLNYNKPVTRLVLPPWVLA